jgi:peptide/nickel transport system permease protein
MQYVSWLSRFVVGDWGRSFSSGSPPVRPLVLERFGNSLRLGALTLVFAVPLSLLLGVVAALNVNRWPDGLISVLSLSVVGLPEFVTGIGANWFPPTSLIPSGGGGTLGDWLRILTLPALTASFVIIGYITRLTRAAVVEEMRKPYVMMAELKGLPRRQVIFKHVLRNALMPSITVIALSVGWLIGGLVVVENVFNYPGMGALLVTAVEQKNIPVIQSIAVMIIVALALANLSADLLYAALNPRVRLGG